MAYGLFLPRRWTRQPLGAVEVGNAFGVRPSFLYHPPAGPIDIASGNRALYGRGNVAPSPFGLGNLKLTDSLTDPAILIFKNNPTWLQSQEVTVFALVFAIAGGGNSGFVVSRAMGTGTASFAVGVHRGTFDGPIYQLNGTSADFSATSPPGNAVLPDEEIEAKPLFVALTFKNGTARASLNGRYITEATGLGSIDYSRTDQAILLGAGYNTGSSGYLNQFRGYTLLAGVLGHAFPDDGITELAQNPWQILKPRATIFYSLPAAGGSTAPVLSLPGVQSITATSAVPKVTVTFS